MDGNVTRHKHKEIICMSYVVHDDDVVGGLKVVQLVRDEYPRGVTQVPTDALIEQLPTHVGIHC